MKAALTGHLVLSTLHTNDAASTVPRLVDMGAEPFLIASTVEMITAQRLLRRLCPRCKEQAPVPAEALERLGVPVDASGRYFRAVGCDGCDGTGYSGRLAVAEVLVFDDTMRLLVARGSDEGALRRHAIEVAGMSTLRQDALRKVSQGLTTLEEVVRVTA
jgi:type II secretory ATPase GspE/PulE/Tfp pilus assembly ATPase PilB-like protein